METPAEKPPPRVIRRRAGVACVHCRKRKVRCDVSQRGSPCAICYLDNLDCRVVPRVNRRNTFVMGQEHKVHLRTPSVSHQATQGENQPFSPETEPMDEGIGTPSDFLPDDPCDKHCVAEDDTSDPAASLPQMDTGLADESESPPVDETFPDLHEDDGFFRKESFRPPSQDRLPSSTWTAGRQLGQTKCHDVLYTFYSFLNLNNLATLSARDVNVLEAQACLRVPTRGILEEFLKQYFRHVHPLLPMIHEGEFWAKFSRNNLGETTGEGISLLLLQAMLFASCNFVSLATIQGCGFESMREARAELYRRAKLLHDFDAEASPCVLSQSALLLSFWVPAEDPRGRRPNTSWLITAIQHARDAGAHRYASAANRKRYHPRGRQTHENQLKRLWWSCIIRDRVISLGLRRKIQITRQTFDLDSNPSLEVDDLSDEVHKSKVYSSETKRALIQLTVRFVKLCIVLTDLLCLTPYPEDGDDAWRQGPLVEEDRASASELSWELSAWFADTRRQFPLSGPSQDIRKARSLQREIVHFYTHTILLYYYSAVASLSQYKMLQAVIPNPLENLSMDHKTLRVTEGYDELQGAISGFADCMQHLMEMRLAHYLPISTSAFSVLPLLIQSSGLHARKKLPHDSSLHQEHYQKQQKQHDVLTEAMRIVGLQYGGVKWFTVIVRQACQLANKWAVPEDPIAQKDATDMASCSPKAFLRLVLTVDMSLSRANYPYNGDLPPSLTELLDAKQEAADKAPSYASIVNPTDMLSWTELERLLGGDTIFFPTLTDDQMQDENTPRASDEVAEVECIEVDGPDMLEPEGLDPPLPTWEEEKVSDPDVVEMLDMSQSKFGSDHLTDSESSDDDG